MENSISYFCFCFEMFKLTQEAREDMGSRPKVRGQKKVTSVEDVQEAHDRLNGIFVRDSDSEEE